jgi:hypothetical protein
MTDIPKLAHRCHDAELDALGDAIGSSGRDAWVYVLEHVRPDTLAHINSLDDGKLFDFLMEDHSTDPFWEDYMDAFGKWEASLLEE